jgi:uncharacterized protein (DUF58 family)
MGSDVAGSRPYRPGDSARAIDWAASARLSSAHGSDEFIVREYLAEEAPRVVVLSDRRPAMSLFPRPLRGWTSLRRCARLQDWSPTRRSRRAGSSAISISGATRGVGAAADAPRAAGAALAGSFDAPEDNLARAFTFLTQTQPLLPAGTFLFVLSDFLMPFDDQAWIAAIERRWDIVPVVIQDPVWERSFPDVGGVVAPVPRPHDRSLRDSSASAIVRRRGCVRRTSGGRGAARELPHARSSGPCW